MSPGSGTTCCSEVPCHQWVSAGLAVISAMKYGLTCAVQVGLHNLAVTELVEVAFDPDSGFVQQWWFLEPIR